MRNATVSLATSLVVLAFSFIGRTVFVRCLSAEYLGLNGLFSNALSLLSLTELGVGGALNYALYAPLKAGETRKVQAVMNMYRRVYIVVGLVIFALGLALTPLIPSLIKDIPEGIPADRIKLYYFLQVASMASSYLFAHERALLVCDQREYVTTLADGVCRIATTVLQAIALFLTSSYLIYLTIMVACTFAENLFVAHTASRLYPYLRRSDAPRLDSDELSSIYHNVPAIFFHKVGSMAVFATDSIIISKFVGLVEAGLYSNYALLIGGVSGLFGKLFSSLQASIGNLMASGDDAHAESVFYHILFANASAYSLAATCLLCLLRPFVEMWLGASYLLPLEANVALVASFYVTGVRKTLLMFKDASGIFRQDMLKPLIEGVVNLAVSIPLAIKYGITGVATGTIISTVGVAFWYEAYTFFRVRYHKGPWRYLSAQLGYLALCAAITAAAFALCESCPARGIVGLALRLVTCAAIHAIAYLALFGRGEHFAYFRSVLGTMVGKVGPAQEDDAS
jgi:O-antigen/teichoic acid export membrane protein